MSEKPRKPRFLPARAYPVGELARPIQSWGSDAYFALQQRVCADPALDYAVAQAETEYSRSLSTALEGDVAYTLDRVADAVERAAGLLRCAHPRVAAAIAQHGGVLEPAARLADVATAARRAAQAGRTGGRRARAAELRLAQQLTGILACRPKLRRELKTLLGGILAKYGGEQAPDAGDVLEALRKARAKRKKTP